MNKMAVIWFTAVLAGLVIAAVISQLLPSVTQTPEQTKAELENYGEQWEQQNNLSLANLYERLAEYAESQAQAAAPTGYPVIDDQLPDQDALYQQAAQYREQAAYYRALAYPETPSDNNSAAHFSPATLPSSPE